MPTKDWDHMHNWKGLLSQNCLFTCDYALCDWDGLVNDSTIWHDMVANGLKLPKDQYLLGDAGFPSCERILVPYRGVCYHLKEWHYSRNSPQNPHKLFNLHHAALCNIIEQIFGVLKH